MAIIANGLTKIYGEQRAVDKLSFEIQLGEIVGFLGPNGAGKSTTMKMLTTYLPPSDGTASIAGFDIIRNPLEVKKNVGYLPESNPLYYDMYIREYLLFAGSIHNIHNLKERIDEVIELTGLTKEIKKKIGDISKGYKQRVGIAQAIIHDPKVLILDEPTSGLDPNQIDEIRNLILDIGKNKAVMLSTHIMQEVEAMCNRVIIVADGKIVEKTTLKNSIVTNSNNTLSTLQIKFSTEVNEQKLNHFFSQSSLEIQQTSSTEWLISCKNLSQLKKELMKFSLEENIEIISFKEHSESLEDIFKKVTKKN